MTDIYPNTPIIEPEPTIYYTLGQFMAGVFLPLVMILFVIFHFRNDKYLYLYAVLMVGLCGMAPVWFIVASGLALVGLDMVSKWAKKGHTNNEEFEVKN